jgi:hypothetical protein
MLRRQKSISCIATLSDGNPHPLYSFASRKTLSVIPRTRNRLLSHSATLSVLFSTLLLQTPETPSPKTQSKFMVLRSYQFLISVYNTCPPVFPLDKTLLPQ